MTVLQLGLSIWEDGSSGGHCVASPNVAYDGSNVAWTSYGIFGSVHRVVKSVCDWVCYFTFLLYFFI